MTLEAHVVTALESNTDLAAFFEERTEDSPWLYSSSSLGIGDNPHVPQFPFIAYNEWPTSPYQAVKKSSNAEQRTIVFYVYDEMGDFTRINKILDAIRKIIKDIAPFSTAEGGWCSDAEWQGKSGRVVDDGWHADSRFGTARFTINEP